MRAYFEDYGCMRCGKFEMYDANGMCLPCNHLIRRRLKTSVRHRIAGRADDRLDLIMLRRKELVSKLLARFAQPSSKRGISHRVNAAVLRNPVDGALGYITPGSSRDRYQNPRSDSREEPKLLGKSVRDMRPGRSKRQG